jgi:hypothetical protein
MKDGEMSLDDIWLIYVGGKTIVKFSLGFGLCAIGDSRYYAVGNYGEAIILTLWVSYDVLSLTWLLRWITYGIYDSRLLCSWISPTLVIVWGDVVFLRELIGLGIEGVSCTGLPQMASGLIYAISVLTLFFWNESTTVFFKCSAILTLSW